MKTIRAVLWAGVALLATPGASAGELEFTGEVSGELRFFPQAPQFPGQFDIVQPSVALEGEVYWESDNRDQSIVFIPFLRLDGQDDDRTHGDIREAYWQYTADEWEVLVGVNRVFFGVTESRHLVNVVNQIDQVEDIDEEDFLGEPMVMAATQQEFGKLSLFVLPGFRERTFPGRSGRLRTPLPVNEDSAKYESSLGQASVDVLARYAHAIGDWDVGVYYFYGTGREPRLLPNGSGTALIPFYDQIHQAGIDIQYTTDAWLWKFEGIARAGQGDPFGAIVGGFEYTIYQLWESDADLGILAEFLYDGRDTIAPVTPFDNDLFLGARLALNDVQDTSMLAGTIIDVRDGSTSMRVEAERRLGDSWKIEADAQFVVNAAAANPLAVFEQDDFIQLRLTWFY
jgi:hypothetical protein